ncbi:MAG: triple tyrosine motif-containing protein [Ignavibacteriales bacterium]|nr:triple tyrosine motif-containing protein [Ignavibacteriales bacterium]
MIKYIFNIIMIFIFCQVIVQAQFSYIKFEKFNINNGLSNNSINCITQSSDGYLWIATKDGLNRYDGQSFKIFKNNPSDPNSLPENYIMYLLESKDGVLWVGTWGRGLCKYDPVHESFIKINKPEEDLYIQCIFEDHLKNIWFGTTTNGLNKLNPKSRNITTYNKDSINGFSFPDNNIMELAEDDQNNLWVGTWGSGLIKFNPVNGQTVQYTHQQSNPNSLSNNRIWYISKTFDHSLLISTDSGLDLININSNTITHNPNIPSSNRNLLSTAIRQTLVDHKNRTWIGSYNYSGLFLLENDTLGKLHFTHFYNEDDNTPSLVCNRIRWLYEDHQKNIWIGTEDGLNKLLMTKSFNQYRYMPLKKPGLGGRVVSGIIEGRNKKLWISYGGGGFDCIDPKTNNIRHFGFDHTNTNSLSADDVVAIYEDKNGIIWIGTSNNGLNRYDPVTNRFKHYINIPGNSLSLRSNWIQQILETSNGLFLIGSNEALQIFDTKKEIFLPFDPEIKNSADRFPKAISVNALFEDREKNIWIGTWLDGLYRYDPNIKRLFHYLPQTNNDNSISGNKVSCVFQDKQGIIWIGTFSGGLNKFEKSTGKFKHYTTLNGLPNDVVFGIMEDNHNDLWISTMKGLAKFNQTSGSFRIYDENDGLINNQFNWHSYFKNREGTMFFGGIDGFISFVPDSIKIDPVGPPVVLASFKVFDVETPLPNSLLTTNEIVLKYNQNFFSIDFNALDLMPVYKHKFAYKLEGIDPDWVNAGTRTTAYYTDIRQGQYRFFVMATNADGIWGKPKILKIIILPAWWNTWWFKILVLIILLVIGVIGYRYRINQLLKIERIRFNIASDLHDEIGSNLSSISVDSQTLMQSNLLNKTEHELSSDISKTAKETVEAMRDIIWFINPRNDVSEDIIFKMKETAAKILSNLEWSFNASTGINLEAFNLEIRRNIFLMYKEALTNVIRHANATKCSVELSGDSKNFQLLINDNGKGFNIDTVKGNNGLKNMKRRAEKMNAKLFILSEEEKGTSIKLQIHS